MGVQNLSTWRIQASNLSLEFKFVGLKSWVLHTWILKNKAESVASWRTAPLWWVCSVYVMLAGQVKEGCSWHFHCAVSKYVAEKSAGNLFHTEVIQIIIKF